MLSKLLMKDSVKKYNLDVNLQGLRCVLAGEQEDLNYLFLNLYLLRQL